jgi:hypothetical protein
MLSASIHKVTEMSEKIYSLDARVATTGLKFNSKKNKGATKKFKDYYNLK